MTPKAQVTKDVRGKLNLIKTKSFWAFHFLMFTYLFLRETEHMHKPKRDRERDRQTDRQNPKKAPGSELSAQSPMNGSNP